MSWKYVILKVGNNELPVLFPSRMVHAHVAVALKGMIVAEAQMLANDLLPQAALDKLAASVQPVAAGDCELDVLSASGRSETLQLSARPDDAAFINMHPYHHGYVGDESNDGD